MNVDADRIVRDETVRVEIEVDSERAPNGAWKNIDQVSYRDTERPIRWPIEFTLDEIREPGHSYNLVALAYDKASSIVARGQAIRRADHALDSGLTVHFDSECFRPNPPCDDGSTCYGGQCVSASETPRETPATGGDAGVGPGPAAEPFSGIAQEGENCDSEGARACAGHGSRLPLRCESGQWRADAMCIELERCDTQDGADRGRCRPMARECVNQRPSEPFCDGEAMKVCADLVSSSIRACGENMQCAPTARGAECACRPGFVPDGTRCSPATDCGENRGGCDTLTECRMVDGAPTCSACPAGYTGTGKDGCAPLLVSLTANHGTLEAPITPEGRAYRIRVPLVSPRVELTAVGPGSTQVSFDTTEVMNGQPWTSPVLSVGEQAVELLLTSEFGVSTRYAITLERTGVQTAYIKASNSEANDWFGIALAGSGDTFVAGAYYEDSDATGVDGDQGNGAADSGAVYVFVRTGGRIAQQAYIKQRDTAPNDFFGTSVAIEGDRLVVGAVHSSLFSTPSSGDRSGAAYVFARQNGKWSEQQKLVPTNPAPGDLFGVKVALSGPILAVGAAYGGRPNADRGGAVYIYEHDGASWRERQIIVADEPTARFGSSLSLSGDRMVVGAPGEDDETGAAYVFVRGADGWMQEQRLRPASLERGAKFGFSTALRGDRIAVGAPKPPPPGTSFSVPPGEVFLFERSDEGWQDGGVLRAPISDRSDYFGASVALSDSALVVGSNGEASAARAINADAEDNSAPWAGAAYVYANTGPGTWASTAYLKADNSAEDAGFGFDLALGDDFLVIAAPLESAAATGINDMPAAGASLNSGALYVFE